MLHGGNTTLAGVNLTGNVALPGLPAGVAGSIGSVRSSTPLQPPPQGGGSTGVLQYMLGPVSAAAGGGAYVWRGSLTLERCVLSRNAAVGSAGRGGGVYVDDASLTLRTTVVDRNWAAAAGGGVALGPAGAVQELEAVGGAFTKNTAGGYGGAVAAGLLLPGDTDAASAAGTGAGATWRLRLDATALSQNAAGRQGGGIACSVCDQVSLTRAALAGNAAAETGGGLSCIGCGTVTIQGANFTSNAAASGGGACLLAAGPASAVQSCTWIGNAAGSAAAGEARRLVVAAGDAAAVDAAGAGAVAPPPAASLPAMPAQPAAASASAALPTLPTPLTALPACGVVGTGGGLCLGLWGGAGFALSGTGRFEDNHAAFGAGLFVEACPEDPAACPLALDPQSLIFRGNSAINSVASLAASPRGSAAVRGPQPGGVLPLQPSDASASITSTSGWAPDTLSNGAGSNGAGVDMYVTNASALVWQEQPVAAPQARAAPGAVRSGGGSGSSGISGASPRRRRMLAPPSDSVAAASARSAPTASRVAPTGEVDTAHSLPNASTNSALELLEQLAARAAAAPAQAPPAAAAAINAGGNQPLPAARAVATAPARLGPISLDAAGHTVPTGLGSPSPVSGSSRLAAMLPLSDGVTVVQDGVSEDGRLVGVMLPVLDQLGGRIANDVAQQLSVQVRGPGPHPTLAHTAAMW
jgi:hypothetical protein